MAAASGRQAERGLMPAVLSDRRSFDDGWVLERKLDGYDRGRLRYAGEAGTGYDRATLTDLRARPDRRERRTAPFTGRVHVRETPAPGDASARRTGRKS